MGAAEPDYPHPIFVGGVGRSGTHVMARLIGASARYHRVRTEARFHSWAGGLPDLCAGRTELGEFLTRMRGEWWRRGANERQGLARIVERGTLDAALGAFEREFPGDASGACRRLCEALLGDEARRRGKPAWAEATGTNITQAEFLAGLFARARFVNMVRDGRAVVAATLKKVNLTDEPARALERWEGMVRGAEAARRALGDRRVLTVVLEELAARDREATYERLARFLELDDPGMRRFFDEEISAERAHVGAWRERMAPADARWVERRYRRLVRRLRRQGITWVPDPA